MSFLDFLSGEDFEEVRPHFNADYYASEYPDLMLEGDALCEHFCSLGWFEGRNPGAHFDVVAYLHRYSDVAKAAINPLLHYIRRGRFEIRVADPSASPSARSFVVFDYKVTDWVRRLRDIVDPSFYLSQFRVTPVIGFDPVAHFAFRGWREGFSPSAGFNLQQLAERHWFAVRMMVNPVVAEQEEIKGNYHPKAPSVELMSTSATEKIMPVPVIGACVEAPTAPPEAGDEVTLVSANAGDDAAGIALIRESFSVAHYLMQRPDVGEAAMDPVVHYFYTGWREGVDPNAEFDTDYYLEVNEDVRLAGVNPSWHFLVVGRSEARTSIRPGGWRRGVLESALEPSRRAETYSFKGEPSLTRSLFRRRLMARVKNNRAGLVLSVSHDCYVTSLGGVQMLWMLT